MSDLLQAIGSRQTGDFCYHLAMVTSTLTNNVSTAIRMQLAQTTSHDHISLSVVSCSSSLSDCPFVSDAVSAVSRRLRHDPVSLMT